MWEIIKHKFAKLGCFLIIALFAIALTAVTKFLLLKFGYNPTEAGDTASTVGEYFIVGILILLLLGGGVLVALQIGKEVKERSSMPHPPPLFAGLRGRSPAPQSPISPMFSRHVKPPDAEAAVYVPKPERSLLFKSCMVLSGLGVLFVVGAVGAILYMADLYEKQSKELGQAACDQAENFVRSYEDREAAGNTPEAVKLAKVYAKDLRESWPSLSSNGASDDKAFHFLTYCFMSQDSVAIMVQIPELRHYTDEAQVGISEFAWTLATIEARSDVPTATKLAVAVKGLMNYSAIMTGTISKTGSPLDDLKTRHSVHDTKPLWPYFIPSPSVSR